MARVSRPPPLFKDAVLFCWTTRAQFSNTLRAVEDHWGCEYKTCFVWNKELRGTGTSSSTLANCS
jgi:hypothetical protein